MDLRDASLHASAVIAALALRPHPEGGHYREVWRDVAPGGARGAGTAIFFLLAAGEHSHWHRVDAAECWHWYAGAALEIEVGTSVRTLGPDLGAGERPFLLVPRDVWQAARSLGAWTLVGCTVAPAFSFDGFELAPPGWVPRKGNPGP